MQACGKPYSGSGNGNGSDTRLYIVYRPVVICSYRLALGIATEYYVRTSFIHFTHVVMSGK